MMATDTHGPLIASCGDCVKVWDSASLTEIEQHNFHDGKVNDLCWNRDNTVLCSSGYDGDRVIFTQCGSSFKKLGEMNISSEGSGGGAVCLSMDRYGRKVFAASSSGGRVHEYDVSEMTLRKSYKTCLTSGGVTSVSLSKSGTAVACASNRSSQVSVIQVGTGDEQTFRVGTATTDSIRAMQFSPWNDPRLGVALDSGALTIWDVTASSHFHTFHHHKGPVTALCYSPLNNLLLLSAGIDKNIVLYDAKLKKFVQSTGVDEPLMSVTALPNGISLYVGSSLGTMYQLDLRKFGSPVATRPSAHTSAVRQIISHHQPRSSHKSVPSSRGASSATNNNNGSSSSRPSRSSKTRLDASSLLLSSIDKTPDDNLRRFWTHKTSVSSDQSTTSSSQSKSTSLSGRENPGTTHGVKIASTPVDNNGKAPPAFHPLFTSSSSAAAASDKKPRRASVDFLHDDATTSLLSDVSSDFGSMGDDCISPVGKYQQQQASISRSRDHRTPATPTTPPSNRVAPIAMTNDVDTTVEDDNDGGTRNGTVASPTVLASPSSSKTRSFVTSPTRSHQRRSQHRGEGDISGSSPTPPTDAPVTSESSRGGAVATSHHHHHRNHPQADMELMREMFVTANETRFSQLNEFLVERFNSVHTHLAKLRIDLEDQIDERWAENQQLAAENARLKEELARCRNFY